MLPERRSGFPVVNFRLLQPVYYKLLQRPLFPVIFDDFARSDLKRLLLTFLFDFRGLTSRRPIRRDSASDAWKMMEVTIALKSFRELTSAFGLL